MDNISRVTFVVANIKKFRVPFYRMLHEDLKKHGIELNLVYSDPSAQEFKRNDSCRIDDVFGVRVRRFYFLDGRILLQFINPIIIFRSDLVVVVQANGYLMNFLFLALNFLRLKKVAYWGHGYNHQGSLGSLSERLKRVLCTKVSWWFSYTQSTRNFLVDAGFDAQRISVINNAVDTRGFSECLARVSANDIASLRDRLGFDSTDIIGVYCGSLYLEKRLDFLLSTAEKIHAVFPRFKLVIVGDGPLSTFVKSFCATRSSVVYFGAAFGTEKVVIFKASSVFLHPGAVGLGILDSFAAGLPFLTTRDARHGPEIAYLIDRENGLFLDEHEDGFASGVLSLIKDDGLLASLSAGALNSAAEISIESMVATVSSGIRSCMIQKL